MKQVKTITLCFMLVFAIFMNSSFMVATAKSVDGQISNGSGSFLKEIDAKDEIKSIIANAMIELCKCEFVDEYSVKVFEHYVEVSEVFEDGTNKSSFLTAVHNGELIDLNEIASVLSYNVSTYTDSGSSMAVNMISTRHDFTWTYSIYFAYAINQGYRFYRPSGVEGKWTSLHDNTISMNTFKITYASEGKEVLSPECLDTSLLDNEFPDLVVDPDYLHVITKTAYNLAEDTIVSRNLPMPSGKAIWFYSSVMSGSGFTIECNYTCNGVTYSGEETVRLGSSYT